MSNLNLFVTIRGRRFGFQYSPIILKDGRPYMTRFILYTGLGTLRLHKFYEGDDLRAPHDHPWDFWTFPLRSYIEMVPAPVTGLPTIQLVRAFHWHKRPAEYRHIVLERADGKDAPFWTFVVTGEVRNGWGFWPDSGFVPHKEWR